MTLLLGNFFYRLEPWHSYSSSRGDARCCKDSTISQESLPLVFPLRLWHRTLRFRRRQWPQRGTSEGYWRSLASDGWASIAMARRPLTSAFGHARLLDHGAPTGRSLADAALSGHSRSGPAHQRAKASVRRALTSAFAKLASIDVLATALTMSSDQPNAVLHSAYSPSRLAPSKAGSSVLTDTSTPARRSRSMGCS